MEQKNKIRICIVLMAVFLLVGIGIGYYILPNTYIIERIEQESGKYVNYFEIMNEYLYPFNETDNVSAYLVENNLYFNHKVPSDRGLYYFHFGLDDEGFIKYIAQWRDP